MLSTPSKKTSDCTSDVSDHDVSTPDLSTSPKIDHITPGRPSCFTSTLQECLFVLVATLAAGQTSIFQGAVVGITAVIGAELEMNSAQITWITAGASLSGGSFLLLFGKVADLFGRRKLLIISMAGLAVSQLAAGFANNALLMNVLSGLIGLFSAAAVPPAVGALGASYKIPSKRKNIAFSCFSAGNPLGFVVGMIVSGVASYAYNWRASFWALAGIYAIFAVFSIWAVPRDDHPLRASKTAKSLITQLDLPGCLLIISGFGCVSSSLSLAGDAPQQWKTPYVIVLLVVGVVILALFVMWQRIATVPLMPLHIWKDREFSLLISIFCLCNMAFVAMIVWLPLYMQRVQHLSALEIAAKLLPMLFSGAVTNVTCALIMHRVSNKLLCIVGIIMATTAFLILSFMRERSLYWAFIFPALIIAVAAIDIQYNITNLYVMSSLPSEQQSIAGGIFNTVSKVCSNIALGISTTIYVMVRNDSGEDSISIKAYLSVFWLCAGLAGLSGLLCPFLKIRTQGNTK